MVSFSAFERFPLLCDPVLILWPLFYDYLCWESSRPEKRRRKSLWIDDDLLLFFSIIIIIVTSNSNHITEQGPLIETFATSTGFFPGKKNHKRAARVHKSTENYFSHTNCHLADESNSNVIHSCHRNILKKIAWFIQQNFSINIHELHKKVNTLVRWWTSSYCKWNLKFSRTFDLIDGSTLLLESRLLLFCVSVIPQSFRSHSKRSVNVSIRNLTT